MLTTDGKVAKPVKFKFYATDEQLALMKRIAWASGHKNISDLISTFVQSGMEGALRMIQDAKAEADAAELNKAAGVTESPSQAQAEGV